jgi:ketosteroid isomerase-like protein
MMAIGGCAVADPCESTLREERRIRRLVSYYTDAVAHLDAARAASVYVEDGIASIAGTLLRGRSEIEAGMRKSFAAFRILHLIPHGGLIDIGGDSARARWSTLELTVKRESEEMNCIFGSYEDELIRSSGVWRFRKRTFSMTGRTLIDCRKASFFERINPSFVFEYHE